MSVRVLLLVCGPVSSGGRVRSLVQFKRDGRKSRNKWRTPPRCSNLLIQSGGGADKTWGCHPVFKLSCTRFDSSTGYNGLFLDFHPVRTAPFLLLPELYVYMYIHFMHMQMTITQRAPGHSKRGTWVDSLKLMAIWSTVVTLHKI